jgi:hypothetical protein
MTIPRRVNFLENTDDLQVLILGRLGFSTDFIVKKTGLSEGQVIYRLAKGHTRRLDYRNGESEEATVVLHAVQKSVAYGLRSELDGKKMENEK